VKYFKNTELAKIYNVSEKSVRNWIQAAREGKLDLQLYEKNDKLYIGDTSKNISLISQLVERGRKYKNTRSYKIVKPTSRFYDLYSPEQILDIISALEIYREIPRQYNYFDGGATYWDRYVKRLATEETPNIFTNTLKLLDINQDYLDFLLSNYRRVNVIDVGVGNGWPVRGILSHLLEERKMGRYIALDISSEMLKIAEDNINQWFEGKVNFEGKQLDINYDRFSSVISNEYMTKEGKDTINLVLVLGGTLGNLRAPDGALKVIHDSMGRKDLLIHTIKLDTETTRRYFDFSADAQLQPLAPQYKFIVDLLNIDPSYYNVEMGYDEEHMHRFLRIRLKVALTINFDFDGIERVVDLNKDDSILMWRYVHQDMFATLDQLRRTEFHPLHASLTDDAEYLLSISRINSL
jgi:hypothetical protein